MNLLRMSLCGLPGRSVDKEVDLVAVGIRLYLLTVLNLVVVRF